jgi:dsRNA-specific ribonuclease
MTEKTAKRDAAYQAYLALYKSKLVNDNLMPMHKETRYNDGKRIEKRAKIVKVSPCFDPWIEISEMRRNNMPLIPANIEFSQELPRMAMLLPRSLPCELRFDLFWNEATTLSVSLVPEQNEVPATMNHYASDVSYILLSSVFRGRILKSRSDFTVLFLPRLYSSLAPDRAWLASITGTVMVETIPDIHNSNSFQRLGLIRNIKTFGRPFTIDKAFLMIPTRDRESPDDGSDVEMSQEELHIEGTTLPKRTDFLHPVIRDTKANMHHTAKQCVIARACSVNRLPAIYSKFALFIPSIIHEVEIMLVADKLSRTILAPIGFSNLQVVITAISASSAREATNYQRLEFLGDSILKFHASVNLSARNPLWHEGLLTSKKDDIVSNGRLSEAALALGLHEFILTQCFTGVKWTPPYFSKLTDDSESNVKTEREMSTKVLADVVESLIGASYIDGGVEKSIRCLHVFLPDVHWEPLQRDIAQLYNGVRMCDDKISPSFFPRIEKLLGYKFVKKSLLIEALTHPCSKAKKMSYQRLEFLGDAILDYIVVQELFGCSRQIPHQDMHLMLTALVNANFLGFLCMSISTDEIREEPVVRGSARISMSQERKTVSLWQFMDHSASWEISTAQQDAVKRYENLADRIREELAKSSSYPWALLLQFQPAKFFSDLIESALGAIFIDSHGSLKECRRFLERIGLWRYMNRILKGGVDILHPLNRLHHAAETMAVSFDTRVEQVTNREGETSRKYICKVRVGEEELVELEDIFNKAAAEARAAAAAADILIERKRRVRKP